MAKERKMELKAKPTWKDRAKKAGAVALAVVASPIPGVNVVAGVAAGKIIQSVNDDIEIAEAEAAAAAETEKVVETAKQEQAPVEANTEETR